MSRADAAVGSPRLDRRALRQALSARYPFLDAVDNGPRAVAAGECDRCGEEPRLVQPCGPPPTDLRSAAGPDWALGRRCAVEVGPDGWCEGHATEAAQAIAWLQALPAEADEVARLWWVATGEVRTQPAHVNQAIALLADPSAAGRSPAQGDAGEGDGLLAPR